MPAVRKQVVTLSAETADRLSHDYVSLRAITKRLANLLGFSFAGEYLRATRDGADIYFVPQHTLLADEAAALGISNEDDLFGGVVPHPFVATKAITHDVVSEHARAPKGWSHALGGMLSGVVLPGYSAFSETDVAIAGRLLLRLGCVRLKPAHRPGGSAQKIVTNERELDEAITALDTADLYRHGVVLEQNVESPTTYSIGEVHLHGRCIAYYGTQQTTKNNHGEEVYGGTDLCIIQGTIEDLLRLELTQSVRIAVAQALDYDRAVTRVFPTFFASRRQYDVVQGSDEQGKCLSGVLEQSWRFGGASAAEIDALFAFAADPTLPVVHASTHELYSSDMPPPANADVYFDGSDERAGRLLKYCVIENHGCAA
ncbi:MAG TPA: DUF3182 family protein [Rudaea sp.]|jgi:hypothetical protein|nr:DUF3182 family protein [Rudaea sp.]